MASLNLQGQSQESHEPTPKPELGNHLPFSYRLGMSGRLLVSILSAVLAAIVASGTHRMGAEENVPYGLLISFALVGMSAWAARSRSGVLGAGFHLLASSAIAWVMAFPGPAGDVLVPVGGKGVFLSFFGLHAGYIWLFGMIVLQLVLLVLPNRCFVVAGSPQAEAMHARSGGGEASGAAKESTIADMPERLAESSQDQQPEMEHESHQDRRI